MSELFEAVKAALGKRCLPYTEGANNGNKFVEVSRLNVMIGIWNGRLVSCPLNGDGWDMKEWEPTGSVKDFGLSVVDKLRNGR